MGPSHPRGFQPGPVLAVTAVWLHQHKIFLFQSKRYSFIPNRAPLQSPSQQPKTCEPCPSVPTRATASTGHSHTPALLTFALPWPPPSRTLDCNRFKHTRGQLSVEPWNEELTRFMPQFPHWQHGVPRATALPSPQACFTHSQLTLPVPAYHPATAELFWEGSPGPAGTPLEKPTQRTMWATLEPTGCDITIWHGVVQLPSSSSPRISQGETKPIPDNTLYSPSRWLFSF